MGCVKRASDQRIWPVLAILAFLMGPAMAAVAQPPSRSFTWFASLVSFDRESTSVTVVVPTTDPVAAYLDRFAAGDRVVLVWTQYDAAADAVMYVSAAEAFDVRSGYLVQAEYIAGDASARTVTFRIAVEGGVVQTLATAAPGTPIKSTSPMKQPGPVTPVVSVALNETPSPRPEPEPEPDPEPELAEITADPSAPTPDIGGQWTLDTTLQGNPVSFGCEIGQADAQLTGTCTSQFLGEGMLAGQLTGNTVALTLSASFNGNALGICL